MIVPRRTHHTVGLGAAPLLVAKEPLLVVLVIGLLRQAGQERSPAKPIIVAAASAGTAWGGVGVGRHNHARGDDGSACRRIFCGLPLRH